MYNNYIFQRYQPQDVRVKKNPPWWLRLVNSKSSAVIVSERNTTDQNLIILPIRSQTKSVCKPEMLFLRNLFHVGMQKIMELI